MPESNLTQEARMTLERYKNSENAARTLLPHWLEFEEFLLSQGTMPSSIREIPEESLRAYSKLLDYQDCHVDDALIPLAAVLLICLHAGCDAKILRTVVIPRVRRPVENRQWDAFRARTYTPLPSSQHARSRRRRARREAQDNQVSHNENTQT